MKGAAGLFKSWLAPHFSSFLALKRAGGAKYRSEVHLLGLADRFFARVSPRPPLTCAHVQAFLASRQDLQASTQSHTVGMVWRSLEHARRHGARVDALPPRPRFRVGSGRDPYILSPDEFARVAQAARRPRPRHPDYVGVTHATILGLLVTTGLRVSEAVSLDVADVDLEQALLTVRSGKFRKARRLVLHETAVTALSRYLHDPRRPAWKGDHEPFFVSMRRQRLTADAAFRVFHDAARLAGLPVGIRKGPRLHDLRHTYAVWRVEAWYRNDRDVNQLLAALSTYMGHVSPSYTRIYLRMNSRLIAQAAQRYEARVERDLGSGL